MNYLHYKMKYLNLKGKSNSTTIVDTPRQTIDIRDVFHPSRCMEIFKYLGTKALDETNFKFIYMVSNKIYTHKNDYLEYKVRQSDLTPRKTRKPTIIMGKSGIGAPIKKTKDKDIVQTIAIKLGDEREIENQIKKSRTNPSSIIPITRELRKNDVNPIYITNDNLLTDILFDFEFNGDQLRTAETKLLRQAFIKKMVTTDIEEKAYLENISRSKAGFTIENWLSENMICPYCKNKTLHSYVRKNMPTVDYICISEDHDMNEFPIFFQVKASLNASVGHLNIGSSTYGRNSGPYFSYDPTNSSNNLIHTGSRNYGETFHNIEINSTETEKMLLVAYICVLYDDVGDNYQLNVDRSFCVLPDKNRHGSLRDINSLINGRAGLSNNSQKASHEELDMKYYQYINERDNVITFSTNNNVIINLGQYIETNLVPKDYISSKIVMSNPRRIIELRDD